MLVLLDLSATIDHDNLFCILKKICRNSCSHIFLIIFNVFKLMFCQISLILFVGFLGDRF